MSSNGGSITNRNIPDVALTATNCYVYALGQGWYGASGYVGTSFAAPLWAGFTALANEQAASQGKPDVGFINPALYSLGVESQLGSAMHDITTGGDGGFNAVSGYDLCTGWGTPQGQSTINDLTEARSFALAYSNQSLYGGATGNNNNRTIAQGNYLYETFMSGGEIFLRRSTDDGSTWDITTQLSDGSGENSKPSAAVYTHGTSTDTVCVVWEKNLGSSYFDIEEAFSGNSGKSWTTPQLLQANVLVSSDQYAGPQPVIASASYGGVQQPPPVSAHSPTMHGLDSQKRGGRPAIASSVVPLLPLATTHRFVVVYTSSSGLQYLWRDPAVEGFWTGPYSISTSYPSSDWFPSLASAGGSPDPDIYLTYDARWYSQIYSQVYDASTDSWSGETVVYDGSAQTSYDRQSCIAVDGTHTFDAWNSQDWNLNGIYIVRFREGSTNGTWGSWEWSYTDGTESQWYPSISDYDYGTYLGMTEYGATSDDIFLQVANIGSQTWQTYTEASNGTNSVLPEETNASGSAVPRVFWTGTAQNSTYQITSANQNLPTTLKTGHPSIVASVGGPQFQIYNRALNGPGVRVQFGDVSATTAQGLTKLIPLKSFDYAKPADLSDPWSYLETDDSVLTTGVASVSFNLSISTADSRRDSVKVANAVVAPTPVEVSVYDGQNLIFDRPLKDTSSVLNLKITATPTNGTIASLRPVVKFETSNGNPDSVVFNTVENMFVPQTLQPKSQQVMSQIPLTFSLSQNYPNPFNPTTRIDYTIAKAGMVSLKVYDVLGREVETIVNENEQPGKYSVNFDGSRLASGVYFYRLEAGSNVITKKMLLMK